MFPVPLVPFSRSQFFTYKFAFVTALAEDTLPNALHPSRYIVAPACCAIKSAQASILPIGATLSNALQPRFTVTVFSWTSATFPPKLL